MNERTEVRMKLEIGRLETMVVSLFVALAQL